MIQEELSSLLNKVKDVVSENDTLTDKVKYGISNESSETDDTVETAVMKTSKFTATSGPNILFESRISELEAQLAQMNIDYRKLSEENNEMRRKISNGISDGPLDQKCSDAYKKQVENLQRDKIGLEETVKKLQKQVTDLKESDINNFSKTQRNLDMAEQANFERTQAEVEIRRLKV
jgi:serologically defined colon cancer antigen 8